MSMQLHQFVESIVQQIDGNQEELADVREEILIHLDLSTQELMKNGFTEEEAMQKVMRNFGDENEVGQQFQQAMYPYRKEMMIALSVFSLLYAYSVYLAHLFVAGDAHIPWLVLATISSATILIFAVQSIPILNRRLWVNSLLIVHLFVFLYGLLLATSLDTSIFSIVLTIISWLIILLAIILVYRTTIYDLSGKLNKGAKLLHFLNITTGIVVVFVTLFFIWAILAFSSELPPTFIFTFIPFVLWIISYASQMSLMSRSNHKSAYTIAVIQTTLIILGFLWFFTLD